MGLILMENSFKFHDKYFLQTHGMAMGTKMAAAFVVIFMAHIEKNNYQQLANKNLPSGRDTSMALNVEPCPQKKSATSLISPIYSSPRSNSRKKCHQKKLFSFVLKFSREHVSLTSRFTLDVRTHYRNVLIYALSAYIVRVTLSVLRRVLLKEKLCVY